MNPFLTLNPFDIIKKFTGGDEEVVEETVEVDQIDGQPLVERTMLLEDHPDFNYMEGAEDRIYEKIKRYNANPAAVTGIMANMLGENDTFDYKKKQDKNKRGDGLGPGIGLFQFDYMKKKYNEYLKSKQLPDSENAQLYWAMDQIYTDNPNDSVLGGPQARKLREILEDSDTTPEKATTAFFEIFENPSAPYAKDNPKQARERAARRQTKLNKRLKNIERYRNKKAGGGSLIERNPYNN
jgi:hypothetical protein|tara:strand:+ start:45 stop:761 length:717 start_codon:yes stop_codon:yes gene_type:complete